MDKFEFASPEWIAVLKERLPIYARQLDPGVEFSNCQVFTKVPKHLDKHGNGAIAVHWRIKNGEVDFRETDFPGADVRTEVEYDFILPIAKLVLTPDNMVLLEAYMAKGAAEGRMKSARLTEIPTVFHGMHNDLAEVTK